VCLVGNDAIFNTVQGNYIGLSIAGDARQPNTYGVYIAAGASSNTIQYNWISGNSNAGVYIVGATSSANQLSGNIIGLASDNATPLGNGTYGVIVQSAPATEIGGPSLGSNVVASNGQSGVYLVQATNTIVQGNTINGNALGGITIVNSNASEISLNTIAYNIQAGVRVGGVGAYHNRISANSIHNNTEKGITLLDGGNQSMQAPTITSATASGASGTASSSAALVEIYSDYTDEGYIYHGSCIVDSNGHWTYNGAINGPYVTALAFDADGNTSEFSSPCALDSCTATSSLYLPLVVR
jgi:parallel beta-helix repeat protein